MPIPSEHEYEPMLTWINVKLRTLTALVVVTAVGFELMSGQNNTLIGVTAERRSAVYCLVNAISKHVNPFKYRTNNTE